MAKRKNEIPAPEWSHVIEADKVGTTPLKMTISPGTDERKRLTKRLGITELRSLEADVAMSRDSGSNVIFISGQIRAAVTQASVVSAKPVKSEIMDSFEAWFADEDKAVSFARAKQERLTRDGQAEMPFLDESEDPEQIVDGKIDVAELVAQYLSLAIDPYPRNEGEEYGQESDGKAGKKGKGEVYENPFAALKEWKNKQDKGE
ncbi:MAG: YceD family protein [Alphaproteobacteria bacterium]